MAKNNQQKPTTLDDLAAMINEGFKSTASKEDIKELRAEMGNLKSTMSDMAEELNATHGDVRYLRRSMDMLVRNDAVQDAALKTLTARVTRLEKKVGLTH
jgi:predicted DNA-binding ArsR family transcriptional regulator